MRNLALLGLILTIAGPASAANLVVVIKDASGQPVENAVATLHPAGAAGPHGAIHFAWPYRMTQQDIAFHPFILIVPAGAEVQFPNKDRVRHHVYSFSEAKRFQLKLYGQDETRSVVFDRIGVVALGCNIHDRMIAFIDVVDTPWAAKSEGGKAVIADAPAGPATLTVWHPFMKAPNGEVSRAVVVPVKGDAQETLVVQLRPAPEGKVF